MELKFEDDKGRRLTIQTNQPYVLRTEEQIGPAPVSAIAADVRDVPDDGDNPDEDEDLYDAPLGPDEIPF